MATSKPIIDGRAIAEVLRKKKYSIKSASSTSVTVLVEGNRSDKMIELAKMLSNFGTKIDRNLKGSSIGGILVGGKVKVFLKSLARGGSGGLDVELRAIADLSNAIMTALADNGGPITIICGRRTVRGITQCIKTAGTPKSDFHLADAAGRPQIHISHKKGSKPNDFQQWGGMTEERIAAHKEVSQFAAQCKALYGDTMPNGESAWMKIQDKKLKMMAVFGVAFDASGVNVNKVDVLLQGDPGLRRVRKGVYELTASGHVHYHGDIPSGGFEPVLSIIYKGDRDQFDIRGARASIYPKEGRRFKTHIDSDA